MTRGWLHWVNLKGLLIKTISVYYSSMARMTEENYKNVSQDGQWSRWDLIWVPCKEPYLLGCTPEDWALYNHSCENLKSCTSWIQVRSTVAWVNVFCMLSLLSSSFHHHHPHRRRRHQRCCYHHHQCLRNYAMSKLNTYPPSQIL